MPKIEVSDEVLGQILEWKEENGLRSRGAALAQIIEKAHQLAAAESLGVDLAAVVRRDVRLTA